MPKEHDGDLPWAREYAAATFLGEPGATEMRRAIDEIRALHDRIAKPEDPARVEAAKEEAVGAAFDRIIADIGFAPPEYWEQTKAKVWGRLERMAAWLADDRPWNEEGALAIDHGKAEDRGPRKPNEEEVAAMRVVLLSSRTLRERLSAYAHGSWSGWMTYLFNKSSRNPDGSVTIPAELVKRWDRQRSTAYVDLPDEEKKSDHAEADKMIAIAHLTP